MRLLSFPKKLLEQSVLTSERLTLRRPAIEDFEAWAELRRASKDFLQPFEPKWSQSELSRNAYRARLRQQDIDITSGRGGHWFLISNDADATLMGGVSLTNIRRGIIECGTLGYWMGEMFASQHYMREAVATVTKHAFEKLALHRVEASTVLNNAASQKLLTACDFEKEGQASAYLKINGEWRDHYLFAKINPADKVR